MKKIAFLLIPVIFLLNTCALEIANVIGPRGGWVFYDKGNYKDKWRYKECAPYDLVELNLDQFIDKNTNKLDTVKLLKEALVYCELDSDDYNIYGWEIPSDHEMRKMLECFTYGLSQFKPDNYYLSVIKHDWKELQPVDPDDSTGTNPNNVNYADWSKWEVVVYNVDFSDSAFGVPKKVENYKGIVKLRPFGRF